jgi:hypothetical protein
MGWRSPAPGEERHPDYRMIHLAALFQSHTLTDAREEALLGD